MEWKKGGKRNTTRDAKREGKKVIDSKREGSRQRPEQSKEIQNKE